MERTQRAICASDPAVLTSEIEALLAPVRVAGREGRALTAEQITGPSAAASQLRACPPAALYQPLTEALCGRHPHLAMQALHDLGLLAQVLPELEATVAFSQEAGRRHKDVWEHTKTVVWQSVPTPAVRWAAALHDIGKVPTRRFLDDGRVSFHGHAEIGERMFLQGPARRIGFPPALRERIATLIRLHLRPGQYDESWTDSAVRRFAREAGPALEDLLNLSRADVTSRQPGKRKRCLATISALGRRLRALAQHDAMSELLPAGLGHALMQELGLPPGPIIGELRRRLRDLCEAGELLPDQPPAYYVERAREWL